MPPSPTADSQHKRLESVAASPSLIKLEAAVQDARTIFDCVQEAIFIHALDRSILDVNQQALRLLGLTKAEALSYRIEDYAAEDSPMHQLPAIWQSVLQGETQTFYWPTMRPSDNHRLELEVTLKKVVLSDQVRVMACVRDITERKRIETEQRRLLGILEATPDLVGMSDAKGNALYLNRAGRDIIGLAEGVSLDFHISETLSRVERQRFIETALPQAIKHGSYCSESTLVNSTGKELPVSRVLIAHKAPSGQVECLSTVMRDIRALKAAEEKLRDREQFLSSIYEGTDISIFAWDLVEDSPNELRCSGWNPSCALATSVSTDFAIGKTPYDIFGPQQGAVIAENNLRCAANKQSIAFEEEIIINGESTWWATKLNPILDEQGRVYRIVGTTTSITELKRTSIELEAYSQRQAKQAKELAATLSELQQTQTQIIQSEKMSSLGEMVAGIAHEINNPVNFIHANIQPAITYADDLIALIKGYQAVYPHPPCELKEMVDDLDFAFIQKDFLSLLMSMHVGTKRIREIVLSLRNFSRLDEADIKAVSLQEGIDSTLVILAHKLRGNAIDQPIEIIKRYQPMPLVECYPSQLNQVVMNIVANAIDALADTEHPQITITTRKESNHAVIAISDNGPGMPDTVKDRIFNPFYTTKPVGKGTGMGLSISYQIVTKKHGGSLSVDSSLSQGTTFLIEIPLKQTIAN